jgi:RNA recognition motif-containing protein
MGIILSNIATGLLQLKYRFDELLGRLFFGGEMDNKLYVGNLPWSTTEEDLRGMFAQAGNVVSVSLIKDRDTGRSKGFAFVELSTQAEAEKAVSLFNNTPLDNRTFKVNLARPKEDSGKFQRSGGNRRYEDLSR